MTLSYIKVHLDSAQAAWNAINSPYEDKGNNKGLIWRRTRLSFKSIMTFNFESRKVLPCGFHDENACHSVC